MKKKAALYDPYLDTLGGGEKHILSIFKALEDEGYELYLFWNNNLQKKIEGRFALKFDSKLTFLPNIFDKKGDIINKVLTLKDFDLFFYVTDGSYFFSSAKKNFVFCMVPNKKLYETNVLNKLKFLNFRFISNSFFTQGWLEKWGVKNEVLYPYINEDFLSAFLENRQKVILSVGRFFRHLHAKKQSMLIKLFKTLKKNPAFKEYKLILAGGLKDEDKDYFESLTNSTKNESDIILFANPSYHELLEIYKSAHIYVHLTGFGIDEEKNPELVEHLGISPLEAMASGCITICYNAGGLKEIIRDGETGFLFLNESELKKILTGIVKNSREQKAIQEKARKYVKENFSYEVFKKRVKKIILQ